MIFLAFHHALSRWARSALLCACVFVIAALPLVSRSVTTSFEQSLRDRASTAPLLIGTRGSRFDLVLASMHWRVLDLTPIEYGVVDEIRREPGAIAIPLHVRFSARSEPIAAVPYEYFEFRGLRPREGRMIAGLGETILGSAAARRLGLGPGDALPSDQRRSYDITTASSVVLGVVGVLAETNTPDDDAVFVDLETAWLLEGIAHGHEKASDIKNQGDLIGKSDDRIALSGAVVKYQRIDTTNADSFHLHGDRGSLPLTGVIVIPENDKSTALVRTRINADRARQAISPLDVADEMVESVLRIRSLFDSIALLVGAAMIGLLVLIGVLTVRSRSREIATLRDIGASRSQMFGLILIEFGFLVLTGITLAFVASSIVSRHSVGLISFLA